MKKRYSMLVAVAVGLSACADSAPTQDPAPGHEEQSVGTLSLNLLGSDSDGREYRLRNAVFGISGNPEFPFPGPFPYPDGGAANYQTVSTETDPDLPVIALRVLPGSYYINLQSPDWYLERLSGGIWERVEQAVLISSSYQYAYVYDGGVTAVAFRFGVDGELIDFRSGELQIGIEIEQPGEGPAYPDGGMGFDGGFIGGLLGGLGGGIGGGGTDAGVDSGPVSDGGLSFVP